MEKAIKEEERAVWIGERLFGLELSILAMGKFVRYWTNGKNGHTTESYFPIYQHWLSSPDGIAAVKAIMTERGFNYTMGVVGGDYDCCFYKTKEDNFTMDIQVYGYGRTEQEAVLASAESALKAEAV